MIPPFPEDLDRARMARDLELPWKTLWSFLEGHREWPPHVLDAALRYCNLSLTDNAGGESRMISGYKIVPCSGGYAAFDRKQWGLGRSPAEAIGNLIITGHNQ